MCVAGQMPTAVMQYLTKMKAELKDKIGIVHEYNPLLLCCCCFSFFLLFILIVCFVCSDIRVNAARAQAELKLEPLDSITPSSVSQSASTSPSKPASTSASAAPAGAAVASVRMCSQGCRSPATVHCFVCKDIFCD